MKTKEMTCPRDYSYSKQFILSFPDYRCLNYLITSTLRFQIIFKYRGGYTLDCNIRGEYCIKYCTLMLARRMLQSNVPSPLSYLEEFKAALMLMTKTTYISVPNVTNIQKLSPM